MAVSNRIRITDVLPRVVIHGKRRRQVWKEIVLAFERKQMQVGEFGRERRVLLDWCLSVGNDDNRRAVAQSTPAVSDHLGRRRQDRRDDDAATHRAAGAEEARLIGSTTRRSSTAGATARQSKSRWYAPPPSPRSDAAPNPQASGLSYTT